MPWLLRHIQLYTAHYLLSEWHAKARHALAVTQHVLLTFDSTCVDRDAGTTHANDFSDITCHVIHTSTSVAARQHIKSAGTVAPYGAAAAPSRPAFA